MHQNEINDIFIFRMGAHIRQVQNILKQPFKMTYIFINSKNIDIQLSRKSSAKFIFRRYDGLSCK